MKHPPRPLARFARGPLLVLVLLLAAGCGTPTGIVSGKVTIDGKPLPRGLITFLPQAGRRDPFSARVLQGEYRTDPVPCGKARIIVVATSTTTVSGPPPEAGGSDKVPPPKAGKSKEALLVPERYHRPDTSGLEITIQKGENTFDADLKR